MAKRRVADVEEVDPWEDKSDKHPASSIYRVECHIEVVPFQATKDGTSNVDNLHFKRTMKKQFEEIWNEKKPNIDSMSINVPLKAQTSTSPAFVDEASSSHMTVMLEKLERKAINQPNVEMIVSTTILKKLAGSVFQPQNSFNLRAFREYYKRKMVIFVCDEEFEGTELSNENDVIRNRPYPNDEDENEDEKNSDRKKFSDVQQLLAGISEDENDKNPTRGSQAVLSKLTLERETMDLIVYGEIDLVVRDNPVNAYVLNGRSRHCKLSFNDSDLMNDAFEYLWSKSFWIGVQTLLFGLRRENDLPVEVLQRFSLCNFYKKYNTRNEKLADVATNCVARVLFDIRRMFDRLDPQANILISYEGLKEDDIYHSIKIRPAICSISFWLLREKHHLRICNEYQREVEKAQASKRSTESLADYHQRMYRNFNSDKKDDSNNNNNNNNNKKRRIRTPAFWYETRTLLDPSSIVYSNEVEV